MVHGLDVRVIATLRLAMTRIEQTIERLNRQDRTPASIRSRACLPLIITAAIGVYTVNADSRSMCFLPD
jgi:hypothetical protein